MPVERRRWARRPIVVERIEPQHVPGVDGVGIAHQRLDLGDAEAASARARRRQDGRGPARPAGGAPARSSSRARRAGPLAAREHGRPGVLAGDGLHALQEARGHRRVAATLEGAGDDHDAARRAPGRSRAPSGRCRRSGEGRPRSRRIGRLRKASPRVSGGQVFSSSPPSTARSHGQQARFEQAPDLQRGGWRSPDAARRGPPSARRRRADIVEPAARLAPAACFSSSKKAASPSPEMPSKASPSSPGAGRPYRGQGPARAPRGARRDRLCPDDPGRKTREGVLQPADTAHRARPSRVVAEPLRGRLA